MSGRSVIKALLETGDSFLHLEKQEIGPETVEKLDYTAENLQDYSEYVSKALKTGVDEHLPNYYTVTEKLLENPEILYREQLLRPQFYEKLEKKLEPLRRNRDRSLNLSEIEPVINTTMQEEKIFPRKAIDKEKLLDRVYIGINPSIDEGLSLEERKENSINW